MHYGNDGGGEHIKRFFCNVECVHERIKKKLVKFEIAKVEISKFVVTIKGQAH